MPNEIVKDSTVKDVNKYKEEIINKTIVVPSTKEEYNDFIKTLR